MQDVLVKLKDVSKRYQKGAETVEVLRDLSLDIPRGDFVALMGPSGSGKTTLLNLIGGLDRPTSGSVVVDGQREGVLDCVRLLSSGNIEAGAYAKDRRKQALFLTVTASVLSVALTVVVIVYCYHSTHLHF